MAIAGRVRFALCGIAAAVSIMAATPAAAEWREASTDHFLIYADSGDGWLRGFAERLERFDAAMRVYRHFPAHPEDRFNRVVIYVVPTGEDATKLCGKCGGVGGFYIPRVGGSVAYSARGQGDGELNADIVLFHEYTHHLLMANFPAAIPRWFNEGFAEYHATATVGRSGAVTFGKAAAHRGYGLVEGAQTPIERLLGQANGAMTDAAGDAYYGRAWALTYLLSIAPARAGQLGKYLALISAGKPNLDAAREAFGDLKVLDRELDDFLDRPLRATVIGADRIAIGEVAVRALRPGEAAMMPVRMRSDRGVSHAEAVALVPDARRRAAPYAEDPAVQASLAEAEYDAGNDTEAEAAADRALAADPADREAMLYKGRVHVRRAQDARGDTAAWKEARSWFIKANRLAPDAAEALSLYYTSYLEAGERPTPAAVGGLMRALELSPQAQDVRFLAARQMVLDNRLPMARALLLPLAFDPHRPAAGNTATALVARIDAGATAAELLRSMQSEAGKVP